ncbi:hypothetical protein [Pseudomonas sp.]|uniref:hypothetical protein n=1 Tax=Pseudomonas sp. TaxID=306 RepID=UPI00326755CE
MQIKLITGPMASGKTTKLRAIQARLKKNGQESRLLVGTDAFDVKPFVRAVTQQIAQGHRTVLADDCSPEQIRAIRTLKQQYDEHGAHDEVVIHLVRRA